jgi:signal transduction histidine kinase
MVSDSLSIVLINLFRNSIKASEKEGFVPVRVGLHISRELHAITGHSRLALAVRDRARETFDAKLARDRPADRGLGLVCSLLKKQEGSLSVRSINKEWAKEVVVCLPYKGI